MIQFRAGYRDRLARSIGLDGVPDPSQKVDPTKIFPSTEIALGPNDHKSVGNFYQFNVSPTSFDLDPYFFFAENDYAITVRGGQTTDLNHKKDPLSSGNSHSVQAMVYKGPLYLSGWGYDICGLPMPKNGLPGMGRYFNTKAANDRSLWKTGPVDLRWDDDRKVWVGGPEVIEGKMLTALPAGNFNSASTGSGVIYRGKNLEWSTFDIAVNASGLIKPDPFGGGPSPIVKSDIKEVALITNRNSQISLSPGDHFIAVKVNYEWRVMGAGGGGGCIVGKFKKLNCSAPSIAKTTVPPFQLQSYEYGNVGEIKTHYQIKFFDVGTKKVYYFQTDQELLPDLIPSDSAGGSLVQSNGILDITNQGIVNITQPDGSIVPTNITIPYSGYFSVVAFNNCEMSSDVYTYKLAPADKYVNGIAPVVLVNRKPLSKLFDCPNSDDNFGIVTDDQTGAEYYAIHPFKYIKHDVRVIAAKSNLTVVCNGELKSAYVITEVDECANAGTGLARE